MCITNGDVQQGSCRVCCRSTVWLNPSFYGALKQCILLFILWAGMLFCAPLQAQFDRELLSNATVRVVVKVRNQVVAVASGFVWQKTNQIVTSLHLMDTDPEAIVIVGSGNKRRLARVKSVLPEADLVLLEVAHPFDNWQPLRRFNTSVPKYRSLLTVLGFDKGVQEMSVRELMTGYAKPEMLQQLLPSRAVNLMAESGIFSTKLPIYFLDSSLPLGYSGAPVVDQDGELIGIANGGIENGAAQVSWIIPAANLIHLTRSQMRALPTALSMSSTLFSLDKIMPTQFYLSGIRYGSELIPLPEPIARSVIKHRFWSVAESEDHSQVSTDLSWSLHQFTFHEVSHRQLRFTRVKTRSFAQMLVSSGQSESISRLRTLYQHVFGAYHIDYPNLLFDVYTDVLNGLNIVVPHGAELVVKGDYLLVQTAWLCQICPIGMQFHLHQSPPLLAFTASDRVMSERERATQLLQVLADQHLETLQQRGAYSEFPDVRYIDNYGAGRQIMRAAFDRIDAPLASTDQLNYLVVAHNRDVWFEAQATLRSSLLPNKSDGSGTHCMVNHAVKSDIEHATHHALDPEQASLCRDMMRAFWVLASTHFTSFANRLY